MIWRILISLLLFPVLVIAADPLVTVTVSHREADETYTVDATLEAARQSTVAAQISGRIVEVRFDVGDRVRKGEVIVRIDEREVSDALARARAQLAQAQATLANAQAHYGRTRELFARKFVSQAALDNAHADFRAAQAQLEAATAASRQAETVKGFATVAAPYGGVVAARHVELGETVTPGTPLMTGFDPIDLRVVADIPQLRLKAITPQTPVVAEFPTLDRRVQASSVVLLPTADARTHTTRVRILLPAYIEGTYPGMYARVRFSLGRTTKLLVPASAVVRRTEVTGVYVVAGPDDIRLRQVRLGETVGESDLEVLAGLQPGEKVAIDPVKAAIAMKGRTVR